MAPLACLLRQQGHQVSGSDGVLYPPMSDLLAGAGIAPYVGFDGERLRGLAAGGPDAPAYDLVVVGNAVPRTNPEALVVEGGVIERISMPQAIARFLLEGRRPLVVTGTHGKTTTTSMAAWVYRELGADPGYLIGGWPIGLPGSFAIGGGDRFVLEGDEYNAAYFDRGAKFLHYRAETAIVTSVEWDHADLYPDPESFRAAFARLVSQLPREGHLIACVDEAAVAELADRAPCAVTRYGFGPGAEVRIGPLSDDEHGTRFELRGDSPLLEGRERRLRLRVWGGHNAANATAVWCAARRDGFDHERIEAALAGFAGVRRRLEEVARVPAGPFTSASGASSGRSQPGDIVLVDDFAHHPTEVAKSIDGLRRRHPDRRVVVAFEPRSLSAGRAVLHEAYRKAFATADLVVLAPIFHAGRLAAEERLDLDRLVAELRRDGVEAWSCGGEEIASLLMRELRPGDVVATMSSGSFDGLIRVLRDELLEASRAG
ncbi:MAG: UDP-N-acetylmuramate:L-alanyl-gamma-D-glutamyl-meso-diaminopimelate ligase [Acidobacteria bacterium]|nr:MAG: UDP-N-acetylmuramate:L-alanyl-gamma-D-glutamyl-meso-diaminopimelate ligase [Acidobacteriota bacterium]REK03704.1 MAG: UDP-N-acetylmuramate:L-alanyl-gamma-D-glutamyl-meso-diaminopimelate ligase [Acidobacteriota bacterium]